MFGHSLWHLFAKKDETQGNCTIAKIDGAEDGVGQLLLESIKLVVINWPHQRFSNKLMVRKPVLHPRHPMKGFLFTLAQSRPASLISLSEHTKRRGGHRDNRRDHGGCRGSHSCNCRSGGDMGTGRVKLASWARLVAAREIRRWGGGKGCRDASNLTLAITTSQARLVKTTTFSCCHCS